MELNRNCETRRSDHGRKRVACWCIGCMNERGVTTRKLINIMKLRDRGNPSSGGLVECSVE